MIIMAYNGVTIETAVHSATLSSHCIPAYPEYTSSTTCDATFYQGRRHNNSLLIDATTDESDPTSIVAPTYVVS